MTSLKQLKYALMAAAILFAIPQLSPGAASRNICLSSIPVPTVVISVPNSIDCGGTQDFVGTITTNWTVPGCSLCGYELLIEYDCSFDGINLGTTNSSNNAGEFATVQFSDEFSQWGEFWNWYFYSGVDCSSWPVPGWWIDPAELTGGYTYGGATSTINYTTRWGTNHSNLGIGVSNITILAINDKGGLIKFFDQQSGKSETTMPPSSTALAELTFPTSFPPQVTQWQIDGSTDQQTLGCTITTNGYITSSTNTGVITVRAYVNNNSYWIEGDLHVGCASCDSGGNCNADGSSKLSSVLVTINTGNTFFGESAGYFRIDQSYPSTALSTPAVLKYYSGSLTSSDVNVVRQNGFVQQVYAPQISANVVSNSPYQYQILFYTNNTLTGTPESTWTFQNPDGATSSNRLTVTKVIDGTTSEYDYAWNSALNGWSLTSENGGKVESRYDTTNGAIRTEVHLIYDGSNNLLFQETNIYQTFPWREELIQDTIGGGTNALTTTWQFYTNAVDTNNFSFLYQVITPGNHWERYAYQYPGNIVRRVTQYLDAPVATNTNQENTNRVTLYSYYLDTDGFPTQATTNLLNGQQISWTTEHDAANSSTETEIQTSDPSYSSAYQLKTTTWFSQTPPFVGEPTQVLQPDGTMTFYSYAISADGTLRTNIVSTGQPDPSQSYIVDGSSNVIVLNQAGTQLSQQTYDVASGLLTSSTTTLALDTQGRPTLVQYLDGTTETTAYGCCGIESFTDREGTTTTYNYDPFTKQVTDTTSLGITIHNDYDAAGRQTNTTRIGTDNTSIVQNVSTYDTAGRLTSSTPGDNGSGMNQTTTYFEYFDANNHLINITTNPDGGTKIETHYQDGSLISVAGAATFPLQYNYGMSTTALKYGETTTEVKLGSSGQTNEWTATYQDALGRNFLTIYASASGTPSNCMSYNTVGQLSNQVDPDGVTALYQYNAKGQLAYTAAHISSASTIDFAGIDRITETISDVTNDNGVAVNRTRAFVWSTNNSNSSNLVSTAETSVDGLQSWSIVYNNGIGVTNHSQTVYNPSQGTRTETATAPDGSTQVSVYQYGRLISITLKDASGAQIGQTVYGYDSQGRQNTATDARNGTSTSFFNNADQVAGTLSPSQDGIQSGETTSNLFDGVGRVLRAILTDGTSVTNVYYANSLLQETYGSRTYPVEYMYDAQGRMTTMTTWTNFAANAGAAVTTWNYDGFRGFLTNKVYVGSNGPAYTYTSAGRLASRTWQRTFSLKHGTANLQAFYSYNSAGELSSITYTDSSPSLSYAYDRLGRQINITNGTTVCMLAYDNMGDLISESYSGGPLDGLSVTNAYDPLLRRTALALASQSATLTQYGYDAASRLQGVTNGADSAIYTYLANSPLVGQITFRSNSITRMTTTKSYDNLNRLTQISSLGSAGGASPISFNYGNNTANQRTSVTNSDNSFWVYKYDNLGQVISGRKYWADGTAVSGQQFTNSFDDIGNRKIAAFGGDQTGSNLRIATYTNNSLNQITGRTIPGYMTVIGSANSNATVTVNLQRASRYGSYFSDELPVTNTSAAIWQPFTNVAVLNIGTNVDIVTSNQGNGLITKTPEAFTYDADGNMLSDGRFAYAWDDENRLTNIASQSGIPAAAKMNLAFIYDYMGRRIQKIYSSNSVVQYTNKYVYDGWNLIAELGTNNALVRSYIWGNDLSGTVQGAGGVGGLLVISCYGAAITNSFVAYDGNGNVAGLVNAADGSTIAIYEYGPFGEAIRASGPIAKANPIRFSTKYQDETELIYYGYRYYSTSTGRWVNRDPVGEEGGTAPYVFISNEALASLDFLGLERALAGYVYYLENEQMGASYIGQAQILQNRLTMTHPHYKLLYNKGTTVKMKPVFAERPAQGWTESDARQILGVAEESWIRNLPEGLETKGLLNKIHALSDDKIDNTIDRFGPTEGKQITVRVDSLNLKTRSSVKYTTEEGTEAEVPRPAPKSGAAATESAENVGLMGLDMIAVGFSAYFGCYQYGKQNNISTSESELTLKWAEVLQAGFNRTPYERTFIKGYMYDPMGSGVLYPLGQGAAEDRFKDYQLYRDEVFLFDTKSDVLTIRATPGWQNLP